MQQTGTDVVSKVTNDHDPLFHLLKGKIKDQAGLEDSKRFNKVTLSRTELEALFGAQEVTYYVNKLNACINLLSASNIFINVKDVMDENNNFQAFEISRISGQLDISHKEDSDLINLKWLLASFCADIEIFLLTEEDQQTYKLKMYEKDEIITQLKFSLEKYINLLSVSGIDIDKPL